MQKDPGTLKELRELLAEFDTVMLVTRTAGGAMRARPMATQDFDAVKDCDLWLVTSVDTPKVAEISEEHQVCVAAVRKSDGAYVSISALAEVERNEAEVKRLWKKDWSIWFSGPDDPSVAIMKLDIQHAEYWEPKGGKLRVLFDMTKAAFTGKKPDEGLNAPKTL
jgi:general stress protein 26